MPDPKIDHELPTGEPTAAAAMPSGGPDSEHPSDIGDLPAIGAVLALVAAVPGCRLEDYEKALSAFSAACWRMADARYAAAA